MLRPVSLKGPSETVFFLKKNWYSSVCGLFLVRTSDSFKFDLTLNYLVIPRIWLWHWSLYFARTKFFVWSAALRCVNVENRMSSSALESLGGMGACWSQHNLYYISGMSKHNLLLQSTDPISVDMAIAICKHQVSITRLNSSQRRTWSKWATF
jgi:hypothetical protein